MRHNWNVNAELFILYKSIYVSQSSYIVTGIQNTLPVVLSTVLYALCVYTSDTVNNVVAAARVFCTLTTTMDTSNYNNAWTLTWFNTGRYCNHRLYMSPNGFGLMLYGSVTYNSLSAAIAWRASEKWDVPGLIADQAPVAWITVRWQTTDLSNTADNDILSVISFTWGAWGAWGVWGSSSFLSTQIFF